MMLVAKESKMELIEKSIFQMLFNFYFLIKTFLMPGPFSVLLLISGFIFFFFLKFKKTGKFFLILGPLLIYVASIYPVSYFLVFSLERQYPFLTEERLHLEDFSQVAYVVVLGNGSFYQKHLPMVSQHTNVQLMRLMEGYRIYHALPHTQMILSGGGSGPVAEGEMMKTLLVSLGANPQALLVEGKSGNTWEEAVNIKDMVGLKKIILVTSAVHMPRAMMLFRKAGFDPIPAPADIRFHNFSDRSFWPSGRYLQSTEAAWYEYLGLIKEKIKFLMPVK